MYRATAGMLRWCTIRRRLAFELRARRTEHIHDVMHNYISGMRSVRQHHSAAVCIILQLLVLQALSHSFATQNHDTNNSATDSIMECGYHTYQKEIRE